MHRELKGASGAYQTSSSAKLLAGPDKGSSSASSLTALPKAGGHNETKAGPASSQNKPKALTDRVTEKPSEHELVIARAVARLVAVTAAHPIADRLLPFGLRDYTGGPCVFRTSRSDAKGADHGLLDVKSLPPAKVTAMLQPPEAARKARDRAYAEPITQLRRALRAHLLMPDGLHAVLTRICRAYESIVRNDNFMSAPWDANPFVAILSQVFAAAVQEAVTQASLNKEDSVGARLSCLILLIDQTFKAIGFVATHNDRPALVDLPAAAVCALVHTLHAAPPLAASSRDQLVARALNKVFAVSASEVTPEWLEAGVRGVLFGATCASNVDGGLPVAQLPDALRETVGARAIAEMAARNGWAVEALARGYVRGLGLVLQGAERLRSWLAPWLQQLAASRELTPAQLGAAFAGVWDGVHQVHDGHILRFHSQDLLKLAAEAGRSLDARRKFAIGCGLFASASPQQYEVLRDLAPALIHADAAGPFALGMAQARNPWHVLGLPGYAPDETMELVTLACAIPHVLSAQFVAEHLGKLGEQPWPVAQRGKARNMVLDFADDSSVAPHARAIQAGVHKQTQGWFAIERQAQMGALEALLPDVQTGGEQEPQPEGEEELVAGEVGFVDEPLPPPSPHWEAGWQGLQALYESTRTQREVNRLDTALAATNMSVLRQALGTLEHHLGFIESELDWVRKDESRFTLSNGLDLRPVSHAHQLVRATLIQWLEKLGNALEPVSGEAEHLQHRVTELLERAKAT